MPVVTGSFIFLTRFSLTRPSDDMTTFYKAEKKCWRIEKNAPRIDPVIVVSVHVCYYVDEHLPSIQIENCSSI